MTLPLADALSQCVRHVNVLRAAMAELPRDFDIAAVTQADDALVRITDQFVLRFIKLQDTLGEHVLRPFGADILGEPVTDLPLIDVLHRLERFGYLTAADWLRWRALRNALTHEYPEHPHIRAALLNEAMRAADAMGQLLTRLQQRIAATG